MKFRFTKFSIAIYLVFTLACNTQQMESIRLSETDTLGILKASLDSSLVFVKKNGSQRTADTSAFTSEFRLDTVLQRYFSRENTHRLKYLDNDSLCRIAHQLINEGIHSDKVTNLIYFNRDSVGDYHVVLERGRLITMTRVIKGDTINSCEFGGGLEWRIFLHFKKMGSSLQPGVEHWEIH